MTKKVETNLELDLADKFVQYTHRNIFLTGKAGTGKTTFLHNLKLKSPKRMVVVAPTGVAAINAGGVTIHSFFQMSFGPVLPENASNDPFHNTPSKKKFNKKKIKLIKSLELLVIDEISMVRADLLDGIDSVLRRYKNRFQPFGGVQLLMIGDLQQLAPVVKPEDWRLLQPYYATPYFFSSRAFNESNALSIELKHIYRQQDESFIKILNEIRNNQLSASSIEILNKRYRPDFKPDDKEGYITLTTHNASANQINDEKLKSLKKHRFLFKSKTEGVFPEHSYPAFEQLELKIDAQVMFIKNDSSPEKLFYNGKIGRVTAIDDDKIWVLCENDEFPLEVNRETWQNLKFEINEKTKEVDETVIGEFTQFPLRLAWAITIHKSQGLTFEKAIIDAKASFAHGQTYVAFSRCKTLEGLVLKSKISSDGIICDQSVQSFNQAIEENQPDEKLLHTSKYEYQLFLLDELFNLKLIHFLIQKSITQLNDTGLIFHGDLKQKLLEMISSGSSPLLTVATNFKFQLKQLGAEEKQIEESNIIQERIKKAATYFLSQIELFLLEPLKKSSFETDNQASSKLINIGIEQIAEELSVKIHCLKSVLNGFTAKNYLDAKAEAVLQKPLKRKSDVQTAANTQTKHPDLYETLRFWRKEEAEDDDRPLYYIASTKALIEISNKLPATEKQLLKINGIGKVKVKMYGSVILDMIEDYCFEHEIAFTKDEIVRQKEVKKNSKEISLEMYLGGKSVAEIAKDRAMALSTIESHLAYWIGKGKLKATDFLDKSIMNLIISYLKEHPNGSLSEIKTALNKELSYSEILYALKQFEFDRLNSNL